jgi:beta-glucosidase
MRGLLAEGINLRGYFHWTLADNFEWNEGWHLRFGLYELDPATQVRRPRPSAQVYERVIRESRLQRAEDESWPAETAAVNGNGLSLWRKKYLQRVIERNCEPAQPREIE